MIRAMAQYKQVMAGLGVLVLVTFGGCSKKGITGEIQYFKDNGRAVSEFSEQAPGALGAQKCQTGTVDNIATLLCEYDSADAASKGQSAAEGWFGQTGTALVLRRDRLLLGLSDRNSVDTNGKSMAAISKLFRRVNKR